MKGLESNSSKFHAIFKGIHQLILEDGLKPGDRLPSERELSERLNAGRSSIREVLRSLELLGLITTKRGEGTFLAHYQSHQFVELLAQFILREAKSKQDLVQMRLLLEIGAIRIAIKCTEKEDWGGLEGLVQQLESSINDPQQFKRTVKEFHTELIQMANNYLLTRVWYPVVQFGSTLSLESIPIDEIKGQRILKVYQDLVKALKDREENQAICLLERLFALGVDKW